MRRAPAPAVRWAAGLTALVLLGASPPSRAEELPEPANLLGMSGLVVTPTATVLPSNALRFGVGLVEKKFSYFQTGISDNYNFFITVGFIPRVEISVRGTYLPRGTLARGSQFATGVFDRGGSARILALDEGKLRPSVALGIDDIKGTRRFHSLYAVGSKSVRVKPEVLLLRGTLGYGSDQLEAKNRVVEGVFGGAEVVIKNAASVCLEYDSYKWNAGFRLHFLKYLNAQYVLLDLDIPSGGISWLQRF